MIVSCPSCKTRYHWRAEAGGRGVCDRCEAEVPLVASRPVFFVRARAEAMALGVSARGAAMAAPESFSRPAEPGAPPPAQPLRLVKVPATAHAPINAPDPFEAGSLSLAPAADAGWSSADDVAERAPRAAPPAPRRSRRAARSGSPLRRVAQLVVLLLLTGGGVAAGHYAMMKGVVGPLRVHPAVDPLDPLLVGGLVGMLISWPLIRWMAPRR